MFQMLIISAYLVTCVVYGLEVLLSLVDVERSLALRIIFAPLGQRARQSMHEFHERCARMASEKADKERLWIFLANMEQTNREVFGPRSTERNRRREGAHRAGITSWLDGSSDDDESKDGKVRAHLARHLGACKLRSEGDEETAAHLVECAKESIPLHTFPELWIASCRWRACVPLRRIGADTDCCCRRMMWHLSLIAVAVVAFLGLCERTARDGSVHADRCNRVRARVAEQDRALPRRSVRYPQVCGFSDQLLHPCGACHLLLARAHCQVSGTVLACWNQRSLDGRFIMVYLGERQHRSGEHRVSAEANVKLRRRRS